MLTIVSTIVVLGVLIFVHELGHFLLAKAVGVRVERFSLGFPPKMIGKKIGETEYCLSWIPLGGYVKMFGENPDEVESISAEEKHRSFTHKPTWARFLIVVAGPGFNFLFAFLVFWLVFSVHGLEHLDSRVGRVTAGMPAAEAGLQSGDLVTALDGKPVQYFDEIENLVQLAKGREVRVTVQREEKTLSVPVIPVVVSSENLFGEKSDYYSLGISPYLSAVIGDVSAGMPADKAGMKTGDKIVAMAGRPVRDWYDVLSGVKGSNGEQLQVTVLRDGRKVDMVVTPRRITDQNVQGEEVKVFRIGITNRDNTVVEPINPIRALYLGAVKTWDMTHLTITSVVKLIQAKISIKTLGGPLLIGEMAGKQAKEGLIPLAGLAALLSLNLGILNLLPIPVLDGGHIFFFLLEMIFRRPISLNIREKAQQAGFILLILFMAFVFYNDIARLVSRWDTKATEATVEQSESSGTGHVEPVR